MDAKRFDAITKASSSLPRRQLLGGLVAGTFAPLLGMGGREVRAQLLLCKKSRQCPAGQQCVHNFCAAKCVNGDPFDCKPGGGSGGGCAGAQCFCAKKPGGGSVCVLAESCATLQGCSKQGDCERGQICATGCCGAGDPKFTCRSACFA
jgi:hypothetical protein